MKWIHRTNPAKFNFANHHQNFVPTNICSNEVLSQEMSPSLSKIITVIASFVSINKYCLFKQFKDVYDKVTDTIHGIIAKSSEITDIFPQMIITFWLITRLSCVYWMQPYWKINTKTFANTFLISVMVLSPTSPIDKCWLTTATFLKSKFFPGIFQEFVQVFQYS